MKIVGKSIQILKQPMLPRLHLKVLLFVQKKMHKIYTCNPCRILFPCFCPPFPFFCVITYTFIVTVCNISFVSDSWLKKYPFCVFIFFRFYSRRLRTYPPSAWIIYFFFTLYRVVFLFCICSYMFCYMVCCVSFFYMSSALKIACIALFWLLWLIIRS